jgi:hypothetical protein
MLDDIPDAELDQLVKMNSLEGASRCALDVQTPLIPQSFLRFAWPHRLR